MATESSTTSTTSSTRTLKVSCGDDTRRLAVTFPEQATSEQRFELIENTVRYGFELGDTTCDGLLLTYLDDEGDKCTLQVATVNDLFSLYPQGPIKLQMQHKTTSPAAEAEDSKAGLDNAATAAEGEEASASAPNLQQFAAIGDRLMANFTMGIILPMAAQSANSPERRAASNEAGLNQREALLPLAMQLLEHAERVPESRGYAGAMQQFVDGSDPAHFGDACADILQAWSLSSSKQEVHESFKACVGAMMKVLPAMKHCHAKTEASKEQAESAEAEAEPKEEEQQQQQHDHECDVDVKAAPEGTAAEAASAEAAQACAGPQSQSAGHRMCHVQMMLPWAAATANWRRDANNEAGLLHQDALLPLALQLLEHADRVPESCHLKPAMQQYVDGSDPAHFGDSCADILQAWAQSSSKQEAAESFQACLGPLKEALDTLGMGFFGKGKGKCKGKDKGKGKGEGKGFGKGMKGLRCWWWQRSAEKRAEEEAAAAAAAAGQYAEGSCGGTVNSVAEEAAPTEPAEPDMTDLQSKIDKLLEMGLITDPEVAKEMLLAHGGDTAAVAALLMS